MLRVDRICVWIFIATFALLIPGVCHLRFVDELSALSLTACIVFDCLVNRDWRRYRILWIIIGIMTAYAIYSLTLTRYNTPTAIAVDWLIQLKPFIPFTVMLAVKARFNATERFTLQVIAIANVIVALAIWACGDMKFLEEVIQHVSYIGITIFVSAATYYFSSIGSDGKVSRRDLLITVAMIASGLVCGRSKYYGSAVLALFMILVYSPGMVRRYGLRAILTFTTVFTLIILVGWSKFEYYFLTGNSHHIDTEVLSSYARPVLYATGGLILIEHIPFGSGLASFATFASSDPYSTLYYEYGINNVYGLMPQMNEFICDAFYPSLAQFGLVGIVLFVTFWVYVCRTLRRLVRSEVDGAACMYRIGWAITGFLLVDSIASTTLVQSGGLCCMMLLGMICGAAPEQKDKQETKTTA